MIHIDRYYSTKMIESDDKGVFRQERARSSGVQHVKDKELRTNIASCSGLMKGTRVEFLPSQS